MKKLLLVLLACLVCAACASSSGGAVKAAVLTAPDTENDFPPEEMADVDAFAFFRGSDIVAGWNLGNSMDSHNGQESDELLWGNPRINQEIFNGVKKAGFDIVRIPVTWIGNFGPAPDYHIRERYLARVAEVACYARNAGLKVIINIHHDGATERRGGQIKDQGWLSINKANRNKAGMEEVTAQFTRMWTQIAKYFKNYGDWLLFEPFNEIHDGYWGSGGMLAFQHLIIDQWNQAFVDTVRGTGGNNQSRFLIVPAYCTTPQHTAAYYFNLPKDNTNEKNKLVVTFHYYDPSQFAIEAATHTWGSPEQRRKTIDDMKPVADRFIPQQIPVVMGEYGAVRQPGYEDVRLDYLSYVFTTARDLGIIPIYWDNGNYEGRGERFGLLNRRTGEPMGEDSEAILRIITGERR
jgi:endoglucanase